VFLVDVGLDEWVKWAGEGLSICRLRIVGGRVVKARVMRSETGNWMNRVFSQRLKMDVW
jgi:hypothetical protein